MSVLQGRLDSADWAEKIRLLREEKGWSQKDLADQLGIHSQSISEIERANERLTLERLNRILDALGYRSKVQIEKQEPTTHSDWGPIEAEDPDRRRMIKNARELAEMLASELYERYEIENVYCIGSLAENGGRKFSETSDVDLLVEGLERSELISAKSTLEINILEPPPEGKDFSFDLQIAGELDRSPDSLVEMGVAVPIPNNEGKH